jgi:hypothetical protein
MANQNSPVTVYKAVAKNIYFDGTSYRVRVVSNGKKYSQYFGNQRSAVVFRNRILNQAAKA